MFPSFGNLGSSLAKEAAKSLQLDPLLQATLASGVPGKLAVTSPLVAVKAKNILFLCTCGVPCTITTHHRPVSRTKVIFTPVPCKVNSLRNVQRRPIGFRTNGDWGIRSWWGWSYIQLDVHVSCLRSLLNGHLWGSDIQQSSVWRMIRNWNEETVLWVKCLLQKHGDLN